VDARLDPPIAAVLVAAGYHLNVPMGYFAKKLVADYLIGCIVDRELVDRYMRHLG
jgi:hypothetical protein